jgi:hypothetical protein
MAAAVALLPRRAWSSGGASTRKGGPGVVRCRERRGGLGFAQRVTAATNRAEEAVAVFCSVVASRGSGGVERRCAGGDRGIGRAELGLVGHGKKGVRARDRAGLGGRKERKETERKNKEKKNNSFLQLGKKK